MHDIDLVRIALFFIITQPSSLWRHWRIKRHNRNKQLMKVYANIVGFPFLNLTSD